MGRGPTSLHIAIVNLSIDVPGPAGGIMRSMQSTTRKPEGSYDGF
jgi:hypothetical protein